MIQTSGASSDLRSAKAHPTSEIHETETPAVITGQYFYDGDGNRIKTIVGGKNTYYIGNYYEKIIGATSTTVKKYYYAGGVRVAMSDNGTIRYFVTDHLGSTTRLINADGTEYSETDYLSWGYDGLTPLAMGTSFKYTGQRQAEAGLYFYNARWYDPELGRFIQADSIIPEPGNPLAWDRYSYGFNNPVNSIDPTGHSPFWALNLFASIYIGYEINAARGVSPDYVGIVRANIAMNSTGSIEVAAGLAVQGQFSGKIDDVIGDIWPGDSGYGLAQTNPDQTEAMSLGRLDPHDPSVAILVMQTRIENAQAACQNCNSMDLFMIGALAQNNYLDNDGVNGLTRNSNGDIDWEYYFANPSGTNQLDAEIRQSIIQKPYVNLVVHKYIQDVGVLSRNGWDLPDSISNEDLDYLDSLVWK